MWSKKDVIIFLAGAQAFHTLAHVVINFSKTLPIQFFFITWTPQLNLLAIAINAATTLLLLWWASKLK